MNNNEFYRVVKIIDDMNVVLNCGKNQFISLNDKFQIYSKKAENIIDPDTNESLGELRMVKATVQVTSIFEKMCVCKNTKTFSSTFGLATTFEKRLSLNIDPSQITGDLSGEDEKPIQVGDIAEKI